MRHLSWLDLISVSTYYIGHVTSRSDQVEKTYWIRSHPPPISHRRSNITTSSSLLLLLANNRERFPRSIRRRGRNGWWHRGRRVIFEWSVRTWCRYRRWGWHCVGGTRGSWGWKEIMWAHGLDWSSKDGDGTRSESREGTRWMGKHVEVDFVDSTRPICPTWINSARLVLSVYSLPNLLLYNPFSIADMILLEYERETTHEIGGLAAILWWRSLSFSFSPKSLSLDCFRLNMDIFPKSYFMGPLFLFSILFMFPSGVRLL